MPELIFVIGATASGKSHYIAQQFSQGDFEFLNVYDYQQRAYHEAGFGEIVPFGAEFRCLMQANAWFQEDILKKLEAGRSVVAEQTFYKAKRRIACIDEVRRKLPDVTIQVYIMCPSDALWLENIKKRELESSFPHIKEDALRIEFPNVSEGFDAIYQVVDGRAELRMDPPRPEILSQARKELAQEAKRLRREDEEQKRRAELLERMKTRKFWHYCEVCGKKEYITAQEAYDSGWDYPPDMGQFGLLSPRTCGDCVITGTLFFKINTGKGLPIVCEGDLTPEELVTWRRIRGEPESLLQEEE